MDPLRDMFRHHAWATRTLIDYCEALPREQLEAAEPGTYGPILATLVHLVAADQRYLEHMTGEKTAAPRREDTEPSLAELRTRFEAQGRQWEALLDRAAVLDVTMPARGTWPAVPHAEDLLFLLAIQHGNDHRTQVCTVLGALGLEPPEIDGWSYWAVTRGLSTE